MTSQPVSTAQRPLSTRRKIVFSLLTCLLLFGGAEAITRTVFGWRWSWLDCHRYHAVLGWCLREGWSGRWEWTAGESRINPQGLRDDAPIGPKIPDEKRLLVLGDSITFGARVRTDETYCHHLERLLAEAGRPWRVLNGGVTGYDPAQEADWLECIGLDLEPDALAIGFCWNDIFPSDRSEWATKYAANRTTQWLNERSVVFYSLQRGLQRLLARAPRFLGHAPPGPTRDEVIGQNWLLIEQSYRRIARHARERHLPVVLILFPTRFDAEGLATDDLRERLQKFSRAEGWEVIDLLSVFRTDPNALYLPDDQLHPTAQGHRKAAEFIAREWLAKHLGDVDVHAVSAKRINP